MKGEWQCLSEIERYGETFCLIRDYYGRIPPACGRCVLLRFCEQPRSDEDIEKMVIRIERDDFRSDFFDQMEEDGYYD